MELVRLAGGKKEERIGFVFLYMDKFVMTPEAVKLAKELQDEQVESLFKLPEPNETWTLQDDGTCLYHNRETGETRILKRGEMTA